MFTPINAPHHHHQRSDMVIARQTTHTARLPGHGEELHISALTEDGHRFQFSSSIKNGVYAYGHGVTLKAWQHDRTFYLTTVSVTGPTCVQVTYTIDRKS
jgi:hypothetical protein